MTAIELKEYVGYEVELQECETVELDDEAKTQTEEKE